MIFVIQRVSEASVGVRDGVIAQIDQGLLILVGIEDADGKEDIEWLTKKAVNLRIFNDPDGVMNDSLIDIQGEVIIVSQFTLHASTKKGNRPSYIRAAKPDIAIPLYEQLIEEFKKYPVKSVQSGEFGADMKVSLINDGPVTINIDSRKRI